MMTIPPTKYPRRPRHRYRPRATTQTPPPPPLVLVSGTYEEAVSISLAFDRAIDIGGLDGSQITVDDGAVSGILYAAAGAATLTTPQVVRIELVEIGTSASGEVRLEASAANGIVAASDGAAWAGVSDLELPFP